MAIVVDPDLLNRNEVIYGTTSQKISAYPVGAVVSGIYDPELTDGATTSGFMFRSETGNFITAGVAAGDILSIKTGSDAGHYEVVGVSGYNEIEVRSLDYGESYEPSDWVNPYPGASSSGLVYDLRQETGGNMSDGATEQSVYSFTKEEWRSDSETFGSDDLIRHEFPYEPLTREQFEIGGGTSHDNWDWHSEDTKERVRTGGWDAVDSASDKTMTYAGIVTLGDLDSDAQVYYQPSGVSANPVDFVLTGTVNQAVLVHDVNGAVQVSGYDTRQYFKLFVRKKAKIYAGSDLGAIGVTTMENLVNRFPLTHADDPAIDADDAEIIGHDPYTNFSTKDSGSTGVTADVSTVTGTLTVGGENFLTSGVHAGDVVEITGGTNDNGFFEIISVDSDTQLTLDTTEHGAFSGEAGLTFETHTRRIYGPIVNDGAILEAAAGSGTLTSIVGGFVASGVATNDILRITEAGGSGWIGTYKILEVNSDTQIGIDTGDQAFPSTVANNIDYQILEPGMFLQQKNDAVTLGATGDIQIFDANPDTIRRQSGSWVTDGVQEADVVTLTGASNSANNASFVVRSVSANVLVLDTQHALTAESGSISASVARHFVRSINSVDYPFRWRTFGNDAEASYVYEFIQRELRRTTDIDEGPLTSRGDVTDLLMEYAAPVGKGLNMFIDDLNANDTNNVTYDDAGGVNRAFSFVSAGTITHNNNLQIDTGPAVVRMFFASTPSGDFGSRNAVLVKDSNNVDISYNVTGASKSFTFDYDNNEQGGRTKATNASIVIVAIGTDKAQYVLFEGTITRATGLTFALTSALERNYSNP
jgi:hypothetical protein